MASVYSKNTKGEYVAMRDIFLKHHPTYKNCKKSEQKLLLDLAMSGNVRTETLLEETISFCADLERSSSTGEDFINGDDAKWLSFYFAKNGGGSSCYTSSISNLKNKKGALRIAAYIDYLEEVMFFYVPYHAWVDMTNSGGDKIRLSFNTFTQTISRIHPYRVTWNYFLKGKNVNIPIIGSRHARIKWSTLEDFMEAA